MQSTPGIIRGVFIDTETGGLDPKVHGITEVAAVAFEIDIRGEQVVVTEKSEFQRYVKPSPWLAYSPGALALQSHTGRTTTLEFLEAYGNSEQEVVNRLERFLSDHIYPSSKYWNSQIWAQNADFDHGFLQAMVQRARSEDEKPLFAPRCDWSCSRKFFTKLCAMIYKHNCQCGKIGQKHIMEFYGFPNAQTHTALQDARDGVACLAKMFEDEKAYYKQLKIGELG